MFLERRGKSKNHATVCQFKNLVRPSPFLPYARAPERKERRGLSTRSPRHARSYSIRGERQPGSPITKKEVKMAFAAAAAATHPSPHSPRPWAPCGGSPRAARTPCVGRPGSGSRWGWARRKRCPGCVHNMLQGQKRLRFMRRATIPPSRARAKRRVGWLPSEKEEKRRKRRRVFLEAGGNQRRGAD